MKLLLVGILAVLALGALLVGFLRKQEYQVNSVSVAGLKSLDPSEVQQSAEQFLRGNYLWIIPRTNALLFSKSGMNAYLLGLFPGLSNVDTEFSARNTLTISVTEKRPAYLWCDKNNNCYFVDETGLIYEPSPAFTPGVFIQFSGSLVPMANAVLRSRFASVADFANTVAVVQTLQTYPVDVLGVSYLRDGALAVPSGETDGGIDDLAITFDQIKGVVVDPSAQILIPKNTTPQSVIQDLNLLANDQPFEDLLNSEPNQLDYVDFRFDGKIYYKFGTTSSSLSSTGQTVSLAPQTATSATTVSAPTPPKVVAKKKAKR